MTNQIVTFSDTLNGVTTNYNLSLPNADLTLTPGAPSATTSFDAANNKWVTNSPTGLAGTVFLSGYSLSLPSGLHGSNNPVTWSATFSADTAGLTLNWQWAAAAYTVFSTDYSSLGVKPCDSSTASSYANADHAGTPESFKTRVAGAWGRRLKLHGFLHRHHGGGPDVYGPGIDRRHGLQRRQQQWRLRHGRHRVESRRTYVDGDDQLRRVGHGVHVDGGRRHLQIHHRQ